MSEHATLVEQQVRSMTQVLARIIHAVETLPPDDVRLDFVPALVSGLQKCEKNLLPVVRFFRTTEKDFSAN